MNTVRYFLVVTVLTFLVACGGGGSGGNGGGDNNGGGNGGENGNPQPAPASKFNGTFNGKVATNQNQQSVSDSVNLSLVVHSPLTGTFFVNGGDVGTISGNADGNTATFSGSVTGTCPGSVEGSMTLTDDDTISITMTGSNCSGQFNSSGTLNRVNCIDLHGTWKASESGTVACTYEGQNEEETVDGSAVVTIDQSACNVSYTPPIANAPRRGDVNGNTVNFSGVLAIPLVGDVTFSQNEVTAKGPIADEANFSLATTGTAKGTYQGKEFSCTASSTASFKRCYDVAVFALRGGPFGDFNEAGDPNNSLSWIVDQAVSVDKNRVFAKGINAWDQQGQIRDELAKLNEGCEKPVKVMLVGHSYGGNAVREADFPNMCSRITIDPISSELIAEDVTKLNQRGYVFPRLNSVGRFTNILASPTSIPLQLRGYHIEGLDALHEWVMPDPVTDHFSVIARARDWNIIVPEVNLCLLTD